ncbi:sodium:solute symporter family transporter [Hansschlegelia plantiphila]|uniref:Sodium:solute symporter n=1 Tax=Hansschlegelia plantiphila TaxID=374655 RepID=A0A9W6J4B4_9HYPH|nr:sodium:solute symporter [Hansschlegelia plantiphila]GLK69089.1 sodium:solute symporter [Hansschlegelia plantiphila]
MDKTTLTLTPGLTPALGYSLMVGLGLATLLLAIVVKRALVHNTHDFIISNRKIGFGFGVGSVISVWTWSMAVMMTSAMTFEWGLSGLFWFVAPNGLAVMLLIPFTRVLRRKMPNGYTISEFTKSRFNQSGVATSIVTVTMIFGIILEILINLKGASVVMSTVFGLNWSYAAAVGLVSVLIYSYFGGLWTSVMTATINLLMITVPAAIIVSLAFDAVPGGAPAVMQRVGEANPEYLSVLRPEAAAGFGITLAFGIFAAAIADQTFWQKAWSIKAEYVNRTFLWAGALFYPIPIALGVLGFIGIAYGLTVSDIGGDSAAIGPYLISHLGLPFLVVVAYVLMVLAACYSTIDGASSALSSIVAIDIVKRVAPSIAERRLFVLTKLSSLIGGVIALAIVLSGVDFTTLVLTTYALKTSILLPLILAILWPRTNTIGFVGGIVLAILVGMPIRHFYGDLIGTLSIVGISGITVVVGALLKPTRFDYDRLHTAVALDERADDDAPLAAAAQS